MAFQHGGSRGGLQLTAPRADDQGLVALAQRIRAWEVSPDELLAELQRRTSLAHVTIVTNSICNLTCRHCYLQAPRSLDELTVDEWNLVFERCSVPSLLAFVGKEVFAEDRSVDILARGVEVFASPTTKVGVITNGTRIHAYRSRLEDMALGYFDISIEGIGAVNDAIRGRGAFTAAIDNLKWAAEYFGPRFFVMMTLQRPNVQNVAETAITLSMQYRVQNLCFGLYHQLPYTPRSLELTTSNISHVLTRELDTLATACLPEPLTCFFDLDSSNLQWAPYFERAGILDWSRLEVAGGELFVRTNISESVSIVVKIAPYPLGIWRAVRITPTGDVLAVDDTPDTTRYGQHKLGNLRDTDYRLEPIVAHALSDRLPALIDEFFDAHINLLACA